MAEYGIDPAPVPERYRTDKFKQASIYDIPYPDNYFDYVCSAHVIEHLKDPLKAVIEMARVAKHMVFANIPRYTIDPDDVRGCVKIDMYYLADHPSAAEEPKMKAYLLKSGIWDKLKFRKGATEFWGYEAHHCQWFPDPSDGYDLFKQTGCFRNIIAEVCPHNCGESNIIGYL
jgi:ubiquinone/menaquinone biosynthesis C-methylase UbiE